jgi:hypothetical protein
MVESLVSSAQFQKINQLVAGAVPMFEGRRRPGFRDLDEQRVGLRGSTASLIQSMRARP